MRHQCVRVWRRRRIESCYLFHDKSPIDALLPKQEGVGVETLAAQPQGDTLHIEPQKGMHWSWGDHDKVKLIVTVPALSAAEIAGSGDINIDHVTGPAFKGSIAGSGDIKAAGNAANVKYDIAGSGDIDGGDVVAQTAAVSISGSGGVHAHATGTATIQVIGSGDVILTGGAKCTISKTGSGDVRCS